MIKEIWLHRELISQLVKKDLKIRYQRPALGFLWAFLSPLLSVAILYVIFSLVLKVIITEAPFVLYLMTAIFPWRFFSDSLTISTTSLVDNKNLIKESRFPQYLIPVSIVCSNLVLLLPTLLITVFISAVVLGGVSIYLLILPLVLMVHGILAVGLSLLLSIIYVKWRDIKYVLEAALLFLFYATPAFYSPGLIREGLPGIFKAYLLNPLVQILFGYRVAMLKDFPTPEFWPMGLVLAALAALLFLMAGFYFYRKNQKTINDYLFY